MALYAVNDIRSTIITLVDWDSRYICAFTCFCESCSTDIYVHNSSTSCFLNVWAIWIVINPRKQQLQYTLFRGVFGIVCSVGLLVITQKFAYGMLGLQTPIYFVFQWVCIFCFELLL